MKTPMQELFDELGKAEPTLMNLHSSDGRRFVEKYHDFLIKEEQDKIDFAVGFAKWLKHIDNGTIHYDPETKEKSESIGYSPFDCFIDDLKPIEKMIIDYLTSTTNGSKKEIS